MRYTLVFDCSKVQRGMASSFIAFANLNDSVFTYAESDNFKLPTQWSGAVTQNLAHDPIVKIELPYYFPAEMQPIRTNWATSNRSLSIVCQLPLLSTANQWTRAGSQVLIYASAGDDMRLFFPVTPPQIVLSGLLEGSWLSSVYKKNKPDEDAFVVIEPGESQSYVPAICVGIGLGMGFSYYVFWQRRKFQNQLQGLGAFLSVEMLSFIKESFSQTFLAVCPTGLHVSFKMIIWKLALLSVELLRVREFMDFVLWFCHLSTEFVMFTNYSVTQVWSLWNKVGPSKIERGEAQSGNSMNFSLIMGVLVGLLAVSSGVSFLPGDLPRRFDVSSNRMKNLCMTVNSVGSLSTSIPKIQDMVEDVLYSVFGACDEKVLNLEKLKKSHVDIVEWCERVLVLSDEEHRNLINYDSKLQDEVLDLRVKGIEYMKLLAAAHIEPAVMTTFRSVFKDMEKLVIIAQRSVENRGYKFEPYCVHLFGKPGVGKTFVLKVLISKLLAEYEDKVGLNNIYCRSSEDPFWSKYANQAAVVYDDFGKLDPSLASFDVFGEFLAVKSGEAYSLNMADLPDKGKLFTSKIVGLTSNEGYFKPKTLVNTDAFWRRRDCLLEVINVDPSLRVASDKPAIDFDHLRFVRKDPLKFANSVEQYTFEQIVDILSKDYKAWRDKELLKQTYFESCAFEKGEKQSGPSLRFKQVKQEGVLAFYPVGFLERLLVMADGDLAYAPPSKDPALETLYSLLWNEINDDTDLRNLVIEYLKKQPFRLGFSNFKKKSFSFWSSCAGVLSSPITKIIAGIGVASVIAYSAYALFNKEEERAEEIEHGEIQNMSVGKKIVKLKPHVVTAFAQSGGHDDPMADNLINTVISRNCFEIWLIDGRRVLGLGLKQRFVLLPNHFIDEMNEGERMTVCSFDRTKVEEAFSKRNIIFQNSDADWCIYEFSLRFVLFKDLVKHFVSLVDVQDYDHVSASLVIKESDILKNILMMAEKVGINGVSGVEYDTALRKVVLLKGWRYEINTVKGQCGAPVVAYNKYFKGKIIGIHVAGRPGQSRGWASAITSDDLLSILSRFPSKFILEPKVESGVSQFGLYGDFTIVGNPGKYNFMPPYSKLKKSKIYGEIIRSEMQPSILSTRDERNVNKESPLAKALNKFGEFMPSFNTELADDVQDYVSREILSALSGIRKRSVLSIDEAVAGLESDPWFKSVDRTTSLGYPWRMEGFKRSEIISSDYVLINEEMRNAIEARIEALKLGVVLPVVWMDCLKDEKLPLTKILQCKTRTFSICPFDLLVVMRMYFGSFYSAFVQKFGDFFSCVGINPESLDWNKLFYDLKRKGNKGFSFDYSGFDRRIDPCWFKGFISCVNEFYDDDNSEIRFLLMESHIHRFSFALDLIYQVHWGQPSGGYLTTIFNSYVNACYIRYVYGMIKAVHNRDEWALTFVDFDSKSSFNPSIDDFRVNFIDRNYGDDGVLVGTDLAWKYFDVNLFLLCLSSLNLAITSADDKQKEVILEDVLKLSFLKRKFVLVDGLYLPQIKLGSILEMFNWVRKDVDELMVLEDNFVLAQIFLCSFPASEFNYWCSRILKSLDKVGIKTLYDSRRSLLNEYYK